MSWEDEDGAAQKATDAAQGQTERDEGRRWICGVCAAPIAEPASRVAVFGRRAHFFANPNGNTFEIGCFQRADGCVSVSEETLSHTWFEGFAWAIVVCRVCNTHLGWRYRNKGGEIFFGLILRRLLLDGGSQGKGEA